MKTFLILFSFCLISCPLTNSYAATPITTETKQLTSQTKQDKEVLAFVTEAMNTLYKNYPNNFKIAKQFFNKAGWQAYHNHLRETGELTEINKNKWIISASLEKPPTILKSETVDGKQTWIVQLQLLVTKKNKQGSKQQHYIAQLGLEKAPQSVKQKFVINELIIEALDKRKYI